MEHGRLNAQLHQLIHRLKTTSGATANLFSEHQDLWRELNFSESQVALWEASLSLRSRLYESEATWQVTPDIASHLIALLQQANGRMPLTQVLKRLPAGVTTTEQQIRKLAQQHAQLDIKGPLLVLIN
ncbi:TPA: hypothetical protein ACPWZ0_001295 [Salmonella enterica subsp. enterica serovar Vietnam]|nr:hypothetical protein [Salmonella enterica]HAE8194415.1 hypothetical protein [Salmonella enterica subsp. indica serovar 41:b:1,7]HAU3217207.1 hypothetical protein [Salmonella enterica subsp. indica]